MQNYHDLLSRVMKYGQKQYNARTKKMCLAIVGEQLSYDLSDGFPAITTKKLAFKGVRGELLGFFRGYTNAADFRNLGCQVWNDNANKTQGWLDNPYRKGLDDLGPIYGKQWTAWKDRRIAQSLSEKDRLKSRGYSERMMGEYRASPDDGVIYEWLMEREINQLENALGKLLSDPSDRRIIVSGWNVGELDMMALPPCHIDYRFVAFDNPSGKNAPMVLHVVMTIRSWDLFLGAPFNIASTSLFLSIMARLSGMVPGTVTIQATNAHIYEDHFEQVEEQLSRGHLPPPKLVISEAVKKASPNALQGVFAKIEPDDIYLDGYESHDAIKAPMAA